MVELSYKALDDHLQDFKADDAKVEATGSVDPPAIYLIYGEDLLVEMAFNKLLNALLSHRNRNLNYEPLEGTDENIREAIEKTNTYSLLGGRKVVALIDARLFDSKKDDAKMVRDARQAFAAGNFRRAATLFLRFLAVSDMKLEDLSGPDWQEKLPDVEEIGGDAQWLADTLAYCRSNGLTVPSSVADEGSALQQAIERGFPRGNHLIITTHTIDKRRALFQAIRQAGGLIDCTVAKSERSADRKSRQNVLQELTENRLARHHKTIERNAFEALCEKTGFDLRAFLNNLEKLITYTGQRRRISAEDVERVLQRTKKDPIFTFTNALTDKKRADALFYMHSLLSEGMRPEQILVAILNQMRKLLLIKEFASHSAGKIWFSDCPYGTFRSEVVPAVTRYDKQLLSQLQSWQDTLDQRISPDEEIDRNRPKKKRRPTTELTIVKNPSNVYPVYQLFKKSEKFSLAKLLDAFEHMTAADMRIKTGGEDKSLVLEELVIKICA